MRIDELIPNIKNFTDISRSDITTAMLTINSLKHGDFEIDDNIIDAFYEALSNLEIKICDKCDSLMIDGYCIDNGIGYYCSDECLFTDGYTEEQWLEEYSDEGNSYWTEWDTVDPKTYEVVNELVKRYSEFGLKPDKAFV